MQGSALGSGFVHVASLFASTLIVKARDERNE